MQLDFTNPGFGGYKIKRQKFGIITLIFIMLVGAAFLAMGLLVLKSSSVDKTWVKIQGKVVNISRNTNSGSTMYSPVVSYVVNDTTYEKTSSSSSSILPAVGSTREVAYNPSNPNEAKIVEGNGSNFIVMLFPLTGLAILIIAPILFIKSSIRSKNINNMVKSGQKIQGIIVDIKSTGNGTNNTYTVVASAADASGQVQYYTSDHLNGLGGLAMADYRNNPIPIDIYIDPSNPKNYYVDISDIPNLTPERIMGLARSAATSTQPTSLNPIVDPQTQAQQTPPSPQPPTTQPNVMSLQNPNSTNPNPTNPYAPSNPQQQPAQPTSQYPANQNPQ